MNAREIIIRPIITERAFDMQEVNRYTFEVDKRASKIEIAQAIEELFDVKVLKVNTSNVKPKVKRVKAVVDGTPQHVYVCTRCLRSGKVTRAV